MQDEENPYVAPSVSDLAHPGVPVIRRTGGVWFLPMIAFAAGPTLTAPFWAMSLEQAVRDDNPHFRDDAWEMFLAILLIGIIAGAVGAIGTTVYCLIRFRSS